MAAGLDNPDMDDEAMAQSIYSQALKNWIEPEILKRESLGQITTPVELLRAQIIFGLDGSKVVRLNNEVKGEIKVQINRTVKKGDLLYTKDIEKILFTELDPSDSGFGHITLLSYGTGRWAVTFSFIYGPERVKKYLELGKVFLDQADMSLDKSSRVSLALAMTAAENLVKARISASPRIILNTNTHSGLMSQFARFINDDTRGKVGQNYVDTYKFLKNNFNAVRYNPEYKKINANTIKKHLRCLRELEAETSKIITQIPT